MIKLTLPQFDFLQKRLRKLSRRQTVALTIVVSSLILSGAIFAVAELGGYGQNGPATAPNSLDYGLVGHWDMEEGSGQVVKDKSGNGNDGTLGTSSAVDASDPVFAPGHDSSGENGTGLSFDGKDDYVNFGNGSTLNLGASNFSISFWINVTPGVAGDVLNKYSSGGPGVRIILGTNGVLSAACNYNGSAYDISTYTVSLTNGWHHAVLIVDRINSARWNIDGNTSGTPDTTSLDGNVNPSSSLWLGAPSWNPSVSLFTGSIDEVRIYNRALSDDEIRLLYNQKKPVFEMKFDEGSGTVAHDESFNHNDGTINGATWTEGKNGGALAFDGVDDYVEAGSGSNLRNLTSKSFFMWFNTGTYAAGTHVYLYNNGFWASPYGDIIYLGNGNNIATVLKNSAGSDVINAATYTPGVWNYVGYSWDGATVTYYLNGVVTGSSSFSGTLAGAANHFFLGATSGASGAQNLNGSIDSVRIYNYARTADEVLSDYNDGMAAHLGKNNQDLNRGLVGHWDMEEGSGQVVKDKSGNGNDGTLGTSSAVDASDPVFAPGHDSSGENGTGLKFDGKNDYVNCGTGSSMNFNGTKNLSTSAWVKINSIGPNELIVTRNNDANDAQGSINLSPPGVINFIVTTTNGFKSATSTQTIPINQWTLLTGTYDGSNIKLYINGVLVTTVAETGNINVSSYAGTKIGYPSLTTNGSIDDVRIYNRALSDDEIRQLYNQKKPVLEMKFDEGSGTVARDESFNHNDGTISGATWTTGKNGGALAFDGVDDYVDAGNDNSLNFGTGDFSVDFWVYRTAAGTQGGSYLSKEDPDGNGGFDTYDSMFTVTSSAGAFASVSMSATLGVWQHHVFVVNQTTSPYIRHYIDGTLDNTGYVEIPANRGSVSFARNLLIGYSWRGGLDRYLNGSLDDVRIYNYARTADEVLSDYNDGMAAHLGKNNQDLNRGLVGHWDMEEGSGQTVYDKSGNGNNGTLGSNTAVAADDPVFAPGHDSSGENGTGLEFDGVDDKVPINDPILGSTAMTVCAWAKKSAYSQFQGLVSDYNNWNGSRNFILGYETPADTLRFYVGDGANTDFISSSGFTQDVWHFVCGVFRGGTELSLYIDNNKATKSTTITNIGSGQSPVSNIGGYAYAPSFDGSIDDVRIYNRALSDDEIRQLYNQKKPVLEMKFDEGSGTVAHDESFNHNDGTFVGNTAWTTGKFGTAISSANGGYVNAGSGASLNLSQALSISTWIYPTAEHVGYAVQPIAKWTGDGSAENYVLYYFGTTSGINRRLMFYGTRDGVWGNLSDSYEVSLNTWYHIELVYNSLQGGLLYVNGNRVGGYSGGGVLATNNVSLVIGNDFPGSIDNLLIYNYARTADEVLTDYNNGLAAHLR